MQKKVNETNFISTIIDLTSELGSEADQKKKKREVKCYKVWVWVWV